MQKRLKSKNNLLLMTIVLAFWALPKNLMAIQHHRHIADFYQNLESYFWKELKLEGLHPKTEYEIELGNEKFGFSRLNTKSDSLGNIQISYLPNSYIEKTKIRINMKDSSANQKTNHIWQLFHEEAPKKNYPNFLDEISWHKNKLDLGNYFLLPTSIPYTDTTLQIPTEKNNISAFLLLNPAGEIIWATIPHYQGKYSTNPCEVLPSQTPKTLVVAFICRMGDAHVLFEWNNSHKTPKKTVLFQSKLHSHFISNSNQSFYLTYRSGYFRGLISSKRIEFPQIASIRLAKNTLATSKVRMINIPYFRNFDGRIFLAGIDLDDDRILVGTASPKYYWISTKNRPAKSVIQFKNAETTLNRDGQILNLVKYRGNYYSLQKPQEIKHHLLSKYQMDHKNIFSKTKEANVFGFIEGSFKRFTNFKMSHFTDKSFLFSFYASDTNSVRVHDAGKEYIFEVDTRELSQELLFTRKVSYYPVINSIAKLNHSPFFPIISAPYEISSIRKVSKGSK